MADGTAILNPGGTLPLTIVGVDESTVLQLRQILDPSVHPTGLCGPVAELIAKTGLRCKEIEEYVTRFRQTVASGKDPSVIPSYDWYYLFAGFQLSPSTGRDLVTQYGFENLRFYGRHLNMIDNPRPIPPSHRDRRRFEELARVGLATIGPLMSKGGRSGEAFNLKRLDGSISTGDLVSWIRFCMTVADVLTATFFSSFHASKAAEGYEAPEIAEILKGYKVVGLRDAVTCRFCARMDGKKFPKGSRPKVPFHIGCRCHLIALFS